MIRCEMQASYPVVIRDRYRWARRLFYFLLAVTLVLVLGALVPRPLFHAEPAEPTHRILLLSNPIHTDIAVPLDAAMRERFAFLKQAGMPLDAPGARYLVFGWGGREFYVATPTWSDLRPWPLFKGLTLDRSVMHVDVIGAVSDDHPAVSVLALDDAGLARLVETIRASFAEGEGGPMVLPGVAYGDHDRFFEANGYFTALLGCNTWTSKVLRSGGLATGWWNPVPASLRLSLWMHNEGPRAVAPPGYFPPAPSQR